MNVCTRTHREMREMCVCALIRIQTQSGGELCVSSEWCIHIYTYIQIYKNMHVHKYMQEQVD